MKNTFRVLAAAAMISVFSAPAFAQGGGGGGRGAEMQAQMRAMLFEGITLTDAQKAKIDSISESITKERAALMATREQGAPPSPEFRQKTMALQTKERDEIKKVLTAEQVTVFDANIAKMPQGRRGRGGN